MYKRGVGKSAEKAGGHDVSCEVERCVGKSPLSVEHPQEAPWLQPTLKHWRTHEVGGDSIASCVLAYNVTVFLSWQTGRVRLAESGQLFGGQVRCVNKEDMILSLPASFP